MAETLAEYLRRIRSEQGGVVTGTLGLGTGTKTQVKRKITPPKPSSQLSGPIQRPAVPAPPPIVPNDFGHEAQRLMNAGQLSAPTQEPLVRLTGATTPGPAFLGPGAAQAARFQGITPSTIIPKVQIVQPQPPPRSLGEALALNQPGPLRFFAGGSLAAEARPQQATIPQQQTAVPQQQAVSTAVGGGFAGDVDPEAMRQFAGVGGVKTFEAIEAGNAPAWITPAQVQSWIDIFGFEGSVDDIALSLGYRFNADTGLWERLDPIQYPTTSTYGGRPVSSGVYAAPGTFPRATRGGGYSALGLTNWTI